VQRCHEGSEICRLLLSQCFFKHLKLKQVWKLIRTFVVYVHDIKVSTCHIASNSESTVYKIIKPCSWYTYKKLWIGSEETVGSGARFRHFIYKVHVQQNHAITSKSCKDKNCTYHPYQMPYTCLVGSVHQDVRTGERQMDGDRGYSRLQWQHCSVHPG
jgi:hypothetical protein